MKAVFRFCLLLVAAGVTDSAARPDDPILGLPLPRHPRHPGAVMLHGGGRITDDARARLVELAGDKEARIVLVPSAGHRVTDYPSRQQFLEAMNRRFASWVKMATTGRVSHFEFLSTDNPADADNESFVRPLASATCIWFAGGEQSRLNYRYVGAFPRQTRFQALLRDVLARGGVVGGTSAGMAALPEIMTEHDYRQHPDGPLEVVAAHGLGLFTGAIVEQHFDERGGRVERFVGLLRDSAKLDRLAARPGAGGHMLGLAVESSTALVLQSDRVETLGAGHAHVLIKSTDDRTITWHTLKAGDKGLLRRDARGEVVLVAGR